MYTYQVLVNELEVYNIKFKEIDFKHNIECGYYFNNKIVINKNLTERQKNCILAEELGHHFTTGSNIINQCNIYNRKQEKIARRWAHDKLIGLLAIAEAYEKGIRCKFELAEYLNVTVSFLDEAVANYTKIWTSN